MKFYPTLVLLLLIENICGREIQVETIQNCDDRKQNYLKFNIKDNVITYGRINLTHPVGANVANATFELSLTNRRRYATVATLNEKNICSALSKYLRDFWTDFEKAMHRISIGRCPIEKAIYIIRNHKMDFSKIPRLPLSRGYYRVTVQIMKLGLSEELLCAQVLYVLS